MNIEKRAEELFCTDGESYVHGVKLAIQLAREAADARILEEADRFEKAGWLMVAAELRSTITKPRTREEVLEAALREISHGRYVTDNNYEGTCHRHIGIARRALEGRP